MTEGWGDASCGRCRRDLRAGRGASARGACALEPLWAAEGGLGACLGEGGGMEPSGPGRGGGERS